MLKLFSKASPVFLLKIIFVGAFVSIFSSFVFAQGNDEPDLKKENRFHQIYRSYNLNPTDEGAWSGAATGKAQNYSVQKGDTLWDLSTTLFGQSDFWPKVWSLNSENVQNPHEILPNQTIQFFPGTLGEAPQLTVTEAGQAPAVPPAVDANAVPAVNNEPAKLVGDPNPPDLPERLKNPPPVSDIPESLPGWKYRQETKVEPDLFELTPRKPFTAAIESLPYYISSGINENYGKIVETEAGGKTAADYQYVFVRLFGNKNEKNLLVVKDKGEVQDPVEGTDGRLIEAQGEIEVLELVNADKSIYRALVKRAMVPVEVGSFVIPGRIPNYDPTSIDNMSQAMARVVGGEFDIRRELFGNRGLVFLSGKGLAVNQVYPIYKVHKSRVPNSDVSVNDRLIGKVKVIQTSGSFATAVVIDSKEEIQIGDITNPDVRTR